MKYTTIGNAFKLKSGAGLSAKKMVSGNFPVYGGNGINGTHNEYLFEESKIVIGRVGAYCGNVHKTQTKAWITDNALYIQESYVKYDSTYLIFLLTSLNLNKYASQSGQPLISAGRLKDVKIPLPSLEEQKKIAAILDAADEYRQKTKALIEKYDQLTQSLFLDMFGDPVTNPKGWEVTTIGALFKVKGGKRLPKGSVYSEEKTDRPYLRVTDFQRNGINSSDLKFISKDIHSKISRYILRAEEVYISIAGTIGLAGFIPEELDGANLTENAAKFCALPGTHVLKEYLSYYLNSSFTQANIKSKTMAVGVPKLAIFRIEELPYIHAPIHIQQKFVERVNDLEKQKRQAEASLVKAEELFNSLLQRAFKTGLSGRAPHA